MTKPLLEPGYDGNAPDLREPRNLERWADERDVPKQNRNVDRLEWLLDHKKIEDHQHRAGRELQKWAEIAALTPYASLTGGIGGQGTTRLPDAKCDAIDRVNKARHEFAQWWDYWRLLEMVVLENASLEISAHRLRRPRKWAMPALKDGLDVLSQHFGFASEKRGKR